MQGEKVWDGFMNYGSWHVYVDVSMGWHGLVFKDGHCGERIWSEAEVRKGIRLMNLGL